MFSGPNQTTEGDVMFRRMTQRGTQVLAALACCSLSICAHAQPGTGEQQGRFVAVASDKTIDGYLERISWTNSHSYKWNAPKGYNFEIRDVDRLNRYGELKGAKTYDEAVEHLLRSVHDKRLSNLGIVPVRVTGEGKPEGDGITGRLYQGNSTLIVGTRELNGSTEPASLPGRDPL
jgi:hypothetical protein